MIDRMLKFRASTRFICLCVCICVCFPICCAQRNVRHSQEPFNFPVEHKHKLPHQRNGTQTLASKPGDELSARQLKAFYGEPECPCLSLEELPPPPTILIDHDGVPVDGIDFQTYGVNCASHDLAVGTCLRDSQHQWCQRSWCWVNGTSCNLLHRKSLSFQDRWYSYAACRNLDFFASDARVASLNGRSLRMALIHNDGCFRGTRSISNVDFNGTLNDWYGPTIDLIKIAAERANMTLQLITDIPVELVERSREFFNSTSAMDTCFYAAALGVLDICASLFDIDDRWATTGNFVLLGTRPIKLVIQDDFFLSTDVTLYTESIKTIFEPFTVEAWGFLIFVVIPMLGLMILVNEYGMTGSAYPFDEQVLDSYVDDDDHQRVETKYRKVSICKHIARTMYITILSVLQGAYPQQIVSLGGQITLLGIGFLLLTIVAVYTANLSALLVAEIRFGRVDTLEAALRRGQRICALRSTMEKVIPVYGIDDVVFVNDPVDGLPGFYCEGHCPDARRRVFDYLDLNLAKDEPVGPDALYCHVGLSMEDDLLLLQQDGQHCNKTMPEKTVLDQFWGVPVFQAISDELTTLLLTLTNENVLTKMIRDVEPQPKCSGVKITVADETSALNITQLTGIWVVSFGFAIIGLLISYLRPKIKKRHRRHKGHHVHVLHRWDQTGQRISRTQHGQTALVTTLDSDRLMLSIHDDDSVTREFGPSDLASSESTTGFSSTGFAGEGLQQQQPTATENRMSSPRRRRLYPRRRRDVRSNDETSPFVTTHDA